jgi:hypothetical protein
MFMRQNPKTFVITLMIVLLFGYLSIPQHAMVHTTKKGVEDDTKKTIKVIDSQTGKPIEGALITSGDVLRQTDENGLCYINMGVNKVAVRAYGYLRTEQAITPPQLPETKSISYIPKAAYLFLSDIVAETNDQKTDALPQEIKLVPFTPKALYLSFYGIGHKPIRESALSLVRETELNALVIDVKGDRGMISYKSAIPLVSEVGAQKIITIKEIDSLMKSLKENGIYTIARIVVFKDNPLALKRPDLAVKTEAGGIWRDREDLAWVDPFKKEVWDYNINIAVEAAQHGFDEIQFDYVRFPDTGSPQFSMPNTKGNRVKAISEFLREAKKRLLPYNAFLSADIFGYVCWNLNDTSIGQTLEDLAPHVDYLSPMLYPSGFQYGIPGYRIPVANPYEIIYLSLKRAQERTNLNPVRFRPWLQVFRDYAFDKRHFDEKEIRDQINAVEKFGSHGWMLWNPRNIYSTTGLKRKGVSEYAFQKPIKTIKGSEVSKIAKEDVATVDLEREQVLASDFIQISSEPMMNQSVVTMGEQDPVDRPSIVTESNQ